MVQKLFLMQKMGKFYRETLSTFPFGFVSLKTIPSNCSILVLLLFQQSGGAPAFSHVWLRNSSSFQPYSTGTCGKRSPEPNSHFTIRPSLPTFILLVSSSGFASFTSLGGVNTVTSKEISFSSSY